MSRRGLIEVAAPTNTSAQHCIDSALTPAYDRPILVHPQKWVAEEVQKIIDAERSLLFALNFDLVVEIPNKVCRV